MLTAKVSRGFDIWRVTEMIRDALVAKFHLSAPETLFDRKIRGLFAFLVPRQRIATTHGTFSVSQKTPVTKSKDILTHSVPLTRTDQRSRGLDQTRPMPSKMKNWF